jgi:hypothetical protein
LIANDFYGLFVADWLAILQLSNVRMLTILFGFKIVLSLCKVCVICLAELFLILRLSTLSVKWLLHLVHLNRR